MRVEAARIADERRALSPRARTWWPRLAALFGAIARGDSSMGLPPYYGGLFENTEADLLTRVSLPDGALAPLIEAMSRVQEAGGRRWINYRDLSVQHLGGIYERLLEREPVADAAKDVEVRPAPYARKTSGSYYTPDELVQLILRRAVGPLLDERFAAFAATAAKLGGDRRPKTARLAELATHDPAEAFIGLRVCDPAMGSGHFLVALVDFRRIILKRVIYGVDLNPMAVELAKLSLWLHSFTVGAPLSFLDHHLRIGDSLFGEFVFPVEDDLRARFGLAMSQAVLSARKSAAGMAMIEGLTDADLSEVHASAEALFGGGLGDPVKIASGATMSQPLEKADARDEK